MAYKPIVLELSGELINAIKKKEKNFETFFEFNDEDIVVQIKIKYDKTFKFSYSISAESGGGEIEAEIILNPKFFPVALNSLIAEINEMFRHELEHIGQELLPGKEKYEEFDEVPFYRYLILRHEIPAYIKGLKTRANAKNISSCFSSTIISALTYFSG